MTELRDQVAEIIARMPLNLHCERVKAADAVIALIQKEQGWRDKRSVPVSGEDFLAFIRHNQGGACRVAVARANYSIRHNHRFSWWNVDGQISCPYEPSHNSVDDCWIIEGWQPLPTPTQGEDG